MVAEEHITAFNWAQTQEIDDMMATTLRVNDFLSGLFGAVGITLVDFKVEFGRVWDGDFSHHSILADEISPTAAVCGNSRHQRGETRQGTASARDLAMSSRSYTRGGPAPRDHEGDADGDSGRDGLDRPMKATVHVFLKTGRSRRSGQGGGKTPCTAWAGTAVADVRVGRVIEFELASAD